MYLFNYLFIYSSICLFIYLFIYVLIYLFTYLCTYLFIYSYIYLFTYLFLHLFIYLFIHLFIYLFIKIKVNVTLEQATKAQTVIAIVYKAGTHHFPCKYRGPLIGRLCNNAVPASTITYPVHPLPQSFAQTLPWARPNLSKFIGSKNTSKKRHSF
jgi:hypothetical protein